MENLNVRNELLPLLRSASMCAVLGLCSTLAIALRGDPCEQANKFQTDKGRNQMYLYMIYGAVQCKQDWLQVANFGDVYEAGGGASAPWWGLVHTSEGACLSSQDDAPFKV